MIVHSKLMMEVHVTLKNRKLTFTAFHSVIVERDSVCVVSRSLLERDNMKQSSRTIRKMKFPGDKIIVKIGLEASHFDLSS